MAENKKTREVKPKTQDQRKVAIGRSEDYTVTYSDGVRMSISAFDLKLTFQTTETLFNGDTLITEHTTIVLSPAHAKQLAEKLTANVARYENDIMKLEMNKVLPPIYRDR